MAQNRSAAVMQQRVEAADSLDFFPTPPWATRALVEHVLVPTRWPKFVLSAARCWEPACGQGDMLRPLRETFGEVFGSDIKEYAGEQAARCDFLIPWDCPPASASFQWVITNPPFRLAAQFIERGLDVAADGVAMLVRQAFLEGEERYLSLWSVHPPAIVAPFAERVPMFRGRLDPEGSTATAYCWLVWDKRLRRPRPEVCWIPPCRSQLERRGDYRGPPPEPGTLL